MISGLVLRASTQLFNALSTSATVLSKVLGYYWRSARMVALHNPPIYKVHIVGDWYINSTEPPYVWQIGAGPDAAATQLTAKTA